MKDVIVFAGTSEGRRLYDFCAIRQIDALFSVATEYGREVLRKQETWGEGHVEEYELCKPTVRTGRLSQEEMARLFIMEKPYMVIDATHPYAVEATAQIRTAVQRYRQEAGIGETVYYRVLRRLSEGEGTEAHEEAAATLSGSHKTIGKTGEKPWIRLVEDMPAAVAYLNRTNGNILATTGSKQIDELCKLDGFSQRIYIRILPNPDMLRKCLDRGFMASHMICMQGPFTQEMNEAVMRQYGIRYLLTKQSGLAGGYWEKCRAAQAVGAEVVAISPPEEAEGYSVEEVEQMIGGRFGRHGD